MGVLGVKRKLAGRHMTILLVTLAFLAICVAFTGVFPRSLVETWYSRGIFPVISQVLAPLAQTVSFSWMDLVLPSALVLLAWLIGTRRFRHVLGLIAVGYLFFFLTWGLNYQRMPLISKLDYDANGVTEAAVAELREETAAQLNRLFREKERAPAGEDTIIAEAALRVRSVVRELDGSNFPVPSVKTSRILNPLFRAGGTSGMFNPFGYEALVVDPLLPAERPIVVLHEMAHVLGYANEGEANFVAFLAAIHSSQPLTRYSGWLSLWQYLRPRGGDDLLDPGPRADLEALYERYRQDRVEWVSRAGDRTLNTFLRANRVAGGTRSYSEIVRLAVGTRASWNRFAESLADD